MLAFGVNTNVLYRSVEAEDLYKVKKRRRRCSQYYFSIKHTTRWNRQSTEVVSVESGRHYSVQKEPASFWGDAMLRSVDTKLIAMTWLLR